MLFLTRFNALLRREKKKSRSGALRVLDHAMTGPEGADNCIKFVDVLGLRSLFPLFMKTPKKAKRAGNQMLLIRKYIPL